MYFLPLPGEDPWRISFSKLREYIPPIFVERVRELKEGSLFLLWYRREHWYAWLPLCSRECVIYPFDALAFPEITGPRRWLNMAKKKFLPPGKRPKGELDRAPDCLESLFGDEFPMVWGYLSCRVDADGKAREPASLAIFAEGGGFKGYLHDRQESQKLWAAGDSIHDFLAGLESFLGDTTAHWREDWDGKTGRRK